MLHPQIGSELSRAFVEARRAEAVRGGRVRRPSRRGVSVGVVRLALGSRPVGTGRSIGDAAEVS